METSSKLKEWASEQEHSKFNTPLPINADFNGPIALRRCTDVPCLLLFLLANAALAGIAGYVFTFGDPNRLVTGWDFRGELCGIGSLAGRKYSYFPTPLETMELAVCLEGCPVTVARNAVCLYAPDHTTEDPAGQCYTSYPSKPFFNKYCLPADPVYRAQVMDYLYSTEKVVTRTIGDIYRAWDIVVIAGLIPCTLALAYYLWLYLSRGLIWLAVGLMFALAFTLASLAFLAYEEAWRVDDRLCSDFHMVIMTHCQSDSYSDGYRIFGFTLIGVAGLLVLAVIAKVGRITPGTEYLSMAAVPLKSSNWVIVCLLEYMVAGACVYTVFLSLIAYSASCGDVSSYKANVPGNSTKSLEFTVWTRGLLLYELLMFLWWTSVLVQTSEYLLGGFAATWFFSKDRTRLQAPLRTAFWVMVRYHLGSVIFASIAIPVFRTPRQMLRIVRTFLSVMNEKTEKCGSSVCGCCLECYEFRIKYLNSHIIPYQAIWGSSFLEASKRGFFLISRGPKHTLVPVHSAEFLLWVLQMVLFFSSPLFVYYWLLHTSLMLTGEHTKAVTSVAGLAWLAGFFSWSICEIMGGFVRSLLYSEMTSFLVDREMFIGVQRYSDACFSTIFQEEVNVPTLKEVGEKQMAFTEDSQDDMLADPISSGRKLERLAVESISSQPSIYSDTSDESRYLPGRAVTPQSITPKKTSIMPYIPGMDTARQLQGPAQSTVQASRRREVIENMSPDRSVSSFEDSDEEEEVFREPVARPPTRGDATARGRKASMKSIRGPSNL